ncbi:MAG: hypothetical protein ACLQAT_29720 [Candidatus Binataceae bacterium]
MTLARALLLAAVLLFQSAPALAGSVHAALEGDSELNSQATGGGAASAQPVCATARFEECSSCKNLVVTNDSDSPAKVQTEISGPGFSNRGGMNAFGSLDSSGHRGHSGCDGELAPGEHCWDSIQFCPEQSGTSTGQVKVTIGDSPNQQTSTFDLQGTAVYGSELEAADKVRQNHLAELMKIPHVAKVELDRSGTDILIDVEVDGDADAGSSNTSADAQNDQNDQEEDTDETAHNIESVRRALLPKIDGYEVEVTEYEDAGPRH